MLESLFYSPEKYVFLLPTSMKLQAEIILLAYMVLIGHMALRETLWSAACNAKTKDIFK